MINLKRNFRFSLMLAALLLGGSALPIASWAVSLADAKTQGMVGEQPDGYLGIVKDSADAQALVKDINAKRRAAYEAIAEKHGQKLEDIEAAAAENAINKTAPGNWIKYPDGTWHKK